MQPDPDGAVQSISVEVKLVRRGNELKLALSPDSKSAKRIADPSLLKLMAQAFAAREHLIDDAESEFVGRYSKEHLSKLARLSYLAPDIVSAIINGCQPPQISARQLLRNGNIPFDWAEQRKQLGFA